MLGLRGCRLGIVKPEFTAMQVEAIINAAADFAQEEPEPDAAELWTDVVAT